MADNSKVLFGFSQLHIGTYEVAGDGTVTMGTPYHQEGGVGFSPEAQGDETNFYADDYEYFTDTTVGSRSGDLVVAKFDREFKTQFCGYKETKSGGIAEVINPVKPHIYAAWQVKGDKNGMRVIMYNGTLGNINREYNTMEGSREPVTEALAAKFIGDQKSGILCATYFPGDAGYDTLFTNPPAPELATESAGE